MNMKKINLDYLLCVIFYVAIFAVLAVFILILFVGMNEAQAADCIRPLKTWKWSSS